MKKTSTLLLSLALFSGNLLAADGLIRKASPYSVEETTSRFEKVLESKGMTIFNRIRHSDAAGKVGVSIQPTQLVIFGNPKVGSPLMKCAPTVAIDLPQKALVWKDQAGQVWIGYNDPQYLKKRHGITGCDAQLKKIAGALGKLTGAAVK